MNACLAESQMLDLLAGKLPAGLTSQLEKHAENCPKCCQRLEQLCDTDMTQQWRAWWQESNAVASGTELLDSLGRYERRDVLGSGSFGIVYRCYDTVLQEDVAIKVPHRARIAKPQDVEQYLAEARRWARLSHEGIARFLHADRAAGSCYVVSKFVDGENLKSGLRHHEFSPSEAVSVVRQVAQALHHIHLQRIYHRDIKPSNIILERITGRPFITDFGLSISEDEVGLGPKTAGSLAYMSPEQARGEGHLVDGRTDIYSLGVVFYEMLTGSRPFRGENTPQLLQQIITRPAPPLRASRPDIPRELERICLKALSKRISDRYLTAEDLADDLQHWAADQQPTADRNVRIVPKGLSSFDANDAYFFLDLIPGPRDRDGLPESIRSWKTRIELRDPEETFRVALISGPSGCGKSSLIKAGILPRLKRNIVPLYLAADTERTEERLLGRLRRCCPDLPPEADVVQSLLAIRLGKATEEDIKVLLVIDQFEQWLLATSRKHESELAKALRQCDGQRLQCILIVRDDFYTAVSQFMDELDVRLIQGSTFDRVDLFDTDHARDVLADFGRAYGRLPENPSEMTSEQLRFLGNAVNECAIDDTVIPLRLALFAHMLRNRNWNSETLSAVGGIEGIGVTFLEVEFSRKNPYQARYQEAAQSVLKSLMPESHTELSTQVRSREQLLASSGLSQERGEFQSLMNTLESELKLISPTDSEAVFADDDSAPGRAAGGRQLYQLTHDFLVPSIRQWLNQRQRATRRGRAQLLLEERSSLWNSRREAKQLPTWFEWLRILLLVRRDNWTRPQWKMMFEATRRYVSRAVYASLALVAVVIGIWIVGFRKDQLTIVAADQAASAWKSGDIEQALEYYLQASRIRPEHDALEAVVKLMESEGGLVLNLEPSEYQFRIQVDAESDRLLSTGLTPQVVESAGTLLQSGQHVRLARGHYRVEIIRADGQLATAFPVYIDRDENLFVRRGPAISHIAEQTVISLVLPESIPKGFAYLNPGPLWHIGDPRDASQIPLAPSGSSEPSATIGPCAHDVLSQQPLQRGYLDHGLLMSIAEVTQEEFRRWWGQDPSGLGSQFCKWQMEDNARLREAVLETESVPGDIKRACWRQVLADRNVNIDDLSDSEIIDVVFEQVRQVHQTHWLEFEQRVSQQLSTLNEAQEQLPMAVGQITAICYARTHAPIDPAAFEKWLENQIQLARHYGLQLKQLQQRLQQRNDRFVAMEELPEAPLVRNPLSRIEAFQSPRPLLNAYEEWLRVRTYYGYQVPIERILETTTDLNATENVDLDESTWLWGESAVGLRNPLWGPRVLVDAYAKSIADREELPLRNHLVQWLDWMIEVENREHQEARSWLLELRRTSSLDSIPFPVRYSYGRDCGWDIPTTREWERGFRGADDRSYTWGTAGQGFALVNYSNGPLPAVMAVSTVKDISPYGILHMAGNLSEWVRLEQEKFEPQTSNLEYEFVPSNTAWKASFPDRLFLMGGNFAMDEKFTKAGFMLSLPRISNTNSRLSPPGGEMKEWTGFRVIRRIQGSKFDAPETLR